MNLVHALHQSLGIPERKDRPLPLQSWQLVGTLSACRDAQWGDSLRSFCMQWGAGGRQEGVSPCPTCTHSQGDPRTVLKDAGALSRDGRGPGGRGRARVPRHGADTEPPWAAARQRRHQASGRREAHPGQGASGQRLQGRGAELGLRAQRRTLVPTKGRNGSPWKAGLWQRNVPRGGP